MTNKHLIHQYADTGAILPQYQTEQLSPNMLKTYLRRRVLQAEQSSVFHLMTYELQKYVQLDKEAAMRHLEKKDQSGWLPVVQKDILYLHKGGDVYAEWLRVLKSLDANAQLDTQEYLGLSSQSFATLDDKVWRFVRQRGKVFRKLLENPSTQKERHEYLDKAIQTQMITQDYEMMDDEFILKNTLQLIHNVRPGDAPIKISIRVLQIAVLKKGYETFYLNSGPWPPNVMEPLLDFLIDNDITRVRQQDVVHMSVQLQERYLEKWIELTATQQDLDELENNHHVVNALYGLRDDLHKKWLAHSESL